MLKDSRLFSQLTLSTFLGSLLCIYSLQALSDENEDLVYSFGVVPQQAASKMARNWIPLLEEVGKKAGVKLIFRTGKDIPTFESRLKQSEYDFAYMNPYHYTVFHGTSGYVAFAKEQKKRIVGIITVRQDSAIKDVQELQGKKVAFPAPAAFAATILPRASFKNMGIDVEPVYVSSHDSVYHSVAEGLYEAGGGIMRTLNAVEENTRRQLRILWKTNGYTPHAFAAHSRVNEEIVKKIQHELIEMTNSPTGLALLKAAGFAALGKAQDQDWDDIRALGLDHLN